LPLTESQLSQYLHEGYVAVDDLIPVDAFTLLSKEIEANIDAKARALAAQGKVRSRVLAW
jgi:hypothetical protein